jgi:hypothetical protein
MIKNIDYEELDELLENELKTSFKFENSLWRAGLTNAEAEYIDECDASLIDNIDNSLYDSERGENDGSTETLIFYELLKLRNKLLADRRIGQARTVNMEMTKYMLMVDCVGRKELRHGTYVTIVEYPAPRTGG